MQVIGVLEVGLRHGALLSRRRCNRYIVLSALAHGMSRPLLATALVMQNDLSTERRLQQAFPYRQKIINWIVRYVDQLHIKNIDKHEHRLTPSKMRDFNNVVPQAYLEAARQAINQLGKTADRGKLFRQAESILNSACTHGEGVL